ncbi:MAG: nucleotidyl transferase AbiEii/AbiGii toxin family protein [candidate division Zixibacteria bacterium]|nr:nucleotidyl transferase AbiEii/AbiGii toxin family protein [candidate division Zixibacteria bacterium]
MDTEQLSNLKRIVIQAMFRDDNLLERLVLKGGNALDIVHGLSERASIDFDFSIENDFDPSEIQEIRDRLEAGIDATFREHDLRIIDFNFQEVPQPEQHHSSKLKFWGGYNITFKVVNSDSYSKYQGNIAALRNHALAFGLSPTIKVEISKCEFCAKKEERDFDGYTIYVYSPAMLFAEKLRAICQQLPAYRAIVDSGHRTGRARDFFDIYRIVEGLRVDVTDNETMELIKVVFAAKQVPLQLLNHIGEMKELHEADYPSLEQSVRNRSELKPLSYYFDYVDEICKKLEPLWKE